MLIVVPGGGRPSPAEDEGGDADVVTVPSGRPGDDGGASVGAGPSEHLEPRVAEFDGVLPDISDDFGKLVTR